MLNKNKEICHYDLLFFVIIIIIIICKDWKNHVIF